SRYTRYLHSFPTRRSSDLDRGDIFLGDVAALDLVEELEARSTLGRDHVDLDFAELAGATRLLLVGVGEVDRLREIFAIGDLRSRSEEHTSELQSLAYLVCR